MKILVFGVYMKIEDEELLLMCIDYLQRILNRLCEIGSHPEIIKLSNDIDELIVEYMRLK